MTTGSASLAVDDEKSVHTELAAISSEEEPVEADSDIADLMDEMPKPFRRQMAMIMSGKFGSGFDPNPFWEKVQSEHVPRLIDSVERSQTLAIQEEEKKRRYSVVFCLIGVGVLVFLVVHLGTTNEALLTNIITAVLSFVGGFGVGHYRSHRTD